MKVTVRNKEIGKEVSFNYDLPPTHELLIKKYGAEAVTKAAHKDILRQLKSQVRAVIEKGESEVHKVVAEFAPTVRTRGPTKSVEEKAKEMLSKLSPAQRAQLLAALGK